MTPFSLRYSRAAYVADHAIYGACIVVGPIAALYFAPRREWPAMLLLLAAGTLVWSLLEYVMHRFCLHRLEPFRTWHRQHHLAPQALLGTPTLVSAGLFVGLVFGPAFALSDLWKGAALTLGVVAGYFAYGGVHHAVHHVRPRTQWLRRRKQTHALHHHADDRHYGVTTSLWDWVFRTGRRHAEGLAAVPDSTRRR